MSTRSPADILHEAPAQTRRGRPRGSKNEPPAWLPDATRAYQHGATLPQIGESVGHAWSTVRFWLLRAGITIRPRTDYPKLLPDIERQRQAIELRESGKTYQEIGAVMGISRQRVHQILTRASKAAA